jgi:SAM-dependent methyltransferase
MIKKMVVDRAIKFRMQRKQVFLNAFELDSKTKILDLGSEDGSHINKIIQGTEVSPINVFLADIDQDLLNSGRAKYGFNTILIPKDGKLPISDKVFDIVFCSSVIEHVTLPKDQLYRIKSSKEFREKAFLHQLHFSSEIERIAKGYFVQTPYKWFPLETHTWLPLIGFLPRNIMLFVVKLTNKYWIKSADPDWNLLSVPELKRLFPNAYIYKELYLGITKSLIAIKKNQEVV